ncbi:MAG: OB-fold putative lipoprotein [Deltaproteobacteria bacterium]|jgi:hypothetical protein|nr:OB-fold putative lipoprotein [Deltaproteobacteria bacterium]
MTSKLLGLSAAALVILAVVSTDMAKGHDGRFGSTAGANDGCSATDVQIRNALWAMSGISAERPSPALPCTTLALPAERTASPPLATEFLEVRVTFEGAADSVADMARYAASQILRDYRDNRPMAEGKYKDVRFKVVGIVQDVEIDESGAATAYMLAGSEPNNGNSDFLMLNFRDGEEDAVINLKPGDRIDPVCTGYDMYSDFVILVDCRMSGN